MHITEKTEDEILQHMIDNPDWYRNAEQYLSRWSRLYRDKDASLTLAKKYGKMSRALSRYRKIRKEAKNEDK